MAANLPSPGRSSGDGMESVKSSSSPSLPPLSETLPLPLPGNVPSSLSKAWKKPKFVPYEPYKGAVRPIVREMAHPRKIAPEFVPIRVPPPEKAGRKKTSSGSSGGSVSSGSRQQSVVDKMECLDLAAGDASGGGEVEELRKELKIQQQINSELKNLLVASIGEDWEPRVESLSADKAILGEYVKHYSDSLTRQTEEKDNISIECDVWRSKFLASSLMVDELARCKAILACRCQEAREALQALSDEHSRLATEVRDVNRNLKSCQAYIDGVHERVHSSGPKISSKAEEDVLRLVSEANMRSSLILRSLRDRHQYNEARGRPCSPDARTFAGKDECRVPMTPAQTMAAKVLADLRDMPYVVNENLKSASALYFPINKALPFKCCSHCQGDIKVV